MPRVRKFEDDLILKSFSEGKLYFKGESVRLTSCQDIELTRLIDGNFCGYIIDGSHTVFNWSKKKTRNGTKYFVFEQRRDDENTLIGLHIQLFDSFDSVDISSEFDIEFEFDFILNDDYCYLSTGFEPLDDNHLFFTVGFPDEEVVKCYLLSMLSMSHRYLGNYEYYPSNSDYIVLVRYEMGNPMLFHYNFSPDDIDENHEPFIAPLDYYYHDTIICRNANCACFALKGNENFEKLVLVDSMCHQVDLLQRFPSLKHYLKGHFSDFFIFHLSESSMYLLFVHETNCIAVMIDENGQRSTSGQLGCSSSIITERKYIDLSLNDFNYENCTIYGCDVTGAYGVLKWRESSNEILFLTSIFPEKVYFDGVLHSRNYDNCTHCFFFLKEKRMIVVRDVGMFFAAHNECKYSEICYNPVGEFSLICEVMKDFEPKILKIHWEENSTTAIITELYDGDGYFGIAAGQVVSVAVDNFNGPKIYLGKTKILELPPEDFLVHADGSSFNQTAVIVTDCSVHFFLFLDESEGDVRIQKHVMMYDITDLIRVTPAKYFLEDSKSQLFNVESLDADGGTVHHLYCLDWESEIFFEPITLSESFVSFVGDSWIRVVDGVIKANVVDGYLKTRFRSNHVLDIPTDLVDEQRFPNNIHQQFDYNFETKMMSLITLNVEEDPESECPMVEMYHMPSFIAEADVVQYHMPGYDEYHRGRIVLNDCE
ncbi:hypothetical protein PCE1_003885 [Barthelona sp. PCE]